MEDLELFLHTETKNVAGQCNQQIAKMNCFSLSKSQY